MEIKPIDSDQALLKKIAAGDEHALAVLFSAHHGRLYTFAFKLTRSRQVAEEVIQDVFLNIWLHRENLGAVLNPGGYMNRITRNLSFNALRRISKDAVLTNEFEDDENYADDSTQQTLDYKDSEALVQKAIEKLPKQQQLVYQLCQIEGLTYDQAAAQLKISSSTVHFHMKEALRNIRKYLKQMGIPMIVLTLLIK